MNVETLLKQTRDLNKVTRQKLDELSRALTELHTSGQVDSYVFSEALAKIEAAKKRFAGEMNLCMPYSREPRVVEAATQGIVYPRRNKRRSEEPTPVEG